MINIEHMRKQENLNCSVYEGFKIGPNDLDLMKRLLKTGTDHGIPWEMFDCIGQRPDLCDDCIIVKLYNFLINKENG